MAQPSGGQPSKRLQQTQAQVDEVVDIMRVDVNKVLMRNAREALERDEKLTDLDARADALQEGARQFENTATRLKRKYWWQNYKMWLILTCFIFIIITIVAVVTTLPKSNSSSGSANETVEFSGG